MLARKRIAAIVVVAALACPAVLAAQLPVLRQGSRGPAVALLQVALSDREFGSGPIDGRFGPELAGALMDYQRVQGLASDGVAGPRVWGALRLTNADPETWAFRTVVVEPADTSALGPVPEAPAEQARLKALPYQTVLERIAERYQAARPYLEELNPEAGWPNPAVGTPIRVPGVAYVTVSTLGGGGGAAARDSVRIRSGAPDSVAADTARAPERWEQRAPEGVRVEISTVDEALRVYRGEQLVARYPATVGSDQFPNPVGEWKVVSQVYAPDYRYDPQYLETGRRSAEALRLPPGPNSLVGILWMGLDKEGYGVHGTDDPESIGTRASHGCVRLTNWDAERLARHVGIGTPVTITDRPAPPGAGRGSAG